MESKEQQRREATEEEREEGPTTTLTALPSTTQQQMSPPPQTINLWDLSTKTLLLGFIVKGLILLENDHRGTGHAFDQLLQNLGSSTKFQIPEKLKKNSMPHTSIRRNIYLAKKVKIRAEDDGMFCSCNSTTTSTGVCGGDCLCGMLLSCCTQNCKCGPSCLNKPFQHRPIKKMKLIETKKCGSGIVVDEDIKQGEFVIEYVGEVIDDKMCEERLWKMKHRGDKNFYLCEINRDTVIDATYKGNKSRYINHSCQPNTEMQKWRIDGETRIGIFAIRDIKKGEELTYDYKFVQFGADQKCHCGAPTCRRKLGSKSAKALHHSRTMRHQLVSRSTKKKDLHNGSVYTGTRHLAHKRKECCQNCIGVVVRIWCPQAKRNYGGVIIDFNNLSKKHMILKEDGQFENLDLSKEKWDFL